MDAETCRHIHLVSLGPAPVYLQRRLPKTGFRDQVADRICCRIHSVPRNACHVLVLVRSPNLQEPDQIRVGVMDRPLVKGPKACVATRMPLRAIHGRLSGESAVIEGMQATGGEG